MTITPLHLKFWRQHRERRLTPSWAAGQKADPPVSVHDLIPTGKKTDGELAAQHLMTACRSARSSPHRDILSPLDIYSRNTGGGHERRASWARKWAKRIRAIRDAKQARTEE